MSISTNRFELTIFGFAGTFSPGRAWEAVKPLLDRLWEIIRNKGLLTKGMNHIVYSVEGAVFVGVELAAEQNEPSELERKTVVLEKSAAWSHKGRFSEIQKGYRYLQEEIMKAGEREGKTSIEIYGHVVPSEPLSEMKVVIEIE